MSIFLTKILSKLLATMGYRGMDYCSVFWFQSNFNSFEWLILIQRMISCNKFLRITNLECLLAITSAYEIDRLMKLMALRTQMSSSAGTYFS